MVDWIFENRHLKRYPHFDPIISKREAVALASNPSQVEVHAFYPLMLYTQSWTRFSVEGEKGLRKERPIRYAARRDAYIYSYYRHVLSLRYEEELKKRNLTNSVIAYRRIAASGRVGGKSNIDFAKDAFDIIRSLGNCTVISMDVSGYFESLDHQKIKELWCFLLGVDKLPNDHFKVFKNLTKYAVVDKIKVYQRLGLYGIKRKNKIGGDINGYLVPYRDINKHLVRGDEFRKKIAGKDKSFPSIIESNKNSYGIPQGVPISDLIANLYLIDFDSEIQNWMAGIGGYYTRYSDDILLVVPGDAAVGAVYAEQVAQLIKKFGNQLVIKEEKTSVIEFKSNEDGFQIYNLVSGNKGKNGLEYLGFRYDGRNVYIKDSTLSNLYRKVAYASRRRANADVRRYPDKSEEYFIKKFNYEELIKKFGRVEGFGNYQYANVSDHRHWTFWTYARRAAQLFGPYGMKIHKQLSKYRSNVTRRAQSEIQRAVRSRDRRQGSKMVVAKANLDPQGETVISG